MLAKLNRGMSAIILPLSYGLMALGILMFLAGMANLLR